MNTSAPAPKSGDELTVTLLEAENQDMRDAVPVSERKFRWATDLGAFKEMEQGKESGRPLMAAGAKAGGGGIDQALEAGKLLWSIIKDSKPSYQGSAPSSHVLHHLDPNGLDYPEAKDFFTKWYGYVDRNWTGAEMSRFSYRIYGQYRARPPGGKGIPRGLYLPNFSVQVANVQVNFANFLDVNVVIDRVFNAGTEEDLIAAANLKVSVKSSGLFQTHPTEFLFKITAADGAQYIP